MLATIAACLFAVVPLGAVNVRDFQDQVVDPGGELEDWQPAFQAAIAAARQSLQPLYVPAGEYPIRQTITILPVAEPRNSVRHNDLVILGDGPYHSIIAQQVETLNAIDWTGPSYEAPCTFGRLERLCVTGGRTVLNLKWHNNFTLDTCYLAGAAEFGIYAEGWSSRFLNSTIRWCRQAGIRATAHFNNCVIRDCYFSRDGIGYHGTGGYGNRIEGTGMESCAKAAIFLRGGSSFTICNSYFEGNGYADNATFEVAGIPDTIHLDYKATAVTIHDCILRSNRDPRGALISVAYAIGGRIYDNVLLNSSIGIELRDRCETNQDASPFISGLIVERNHLENVAQSLSDPAAMYAQALRRGCAFRLRLTNQLESPPAGQVLPECLGDEVFDSTGRRWYKATGPSVDDWAMMTE